MKIAVGGLPGSGTTTLARFIERNLAYTHIYAGMIFRDLAKSRGMSLEEFGDLAEKDEEIDKMIDEKQKMLSEKYENCVVEGRMAAHFVDADLNVWLTAPLDVRVRRVGGREKKDLKKSKEEIRRREKSEKKRYRKIYHVDMDDLSMYDLIINTEKWVPAGVYKIVEKAIEVRKW